MRRLTLLLSLLLACFAFADNNQSTPKAALKYFDRVSAEPNLDRANTFYYAKTDDEKKIAKAFAEVDYALAKLKKLAATRWDAKAADAMAHALRDVTVQDIDASNEKIDGDKATITGPGFDTPLPMVKVDGNWKISIADAMKQSQATVSQVEDACSSLVDAMDKTQEEIDANKYANAALAERSVKRRVRGILGGD